MTSEKRISYRLLEEELPVLKDEVLKLAVYDSPQILEEGTRPEEMKVRPDVMRTLNRIIKTFDQLQKDEPKVYEDADVVMVIPGPGRISASAYRVPDRYSELPYAQRMDRARVRIAVAIMLGVTAIRLGKKAGNLSAEDLRNHSPYLHYADPPERMEHFREVMPQLFPYIPPEKIFTYDTFTDETGREAPIVNTADQMRGLKLPEGRIRRIAMVADASHLTRALYILGRTPESIPEGAVVQAWPIHTPRLGAFDHAIRQLTGTIAYIYKLNLASTTSYPYEV